MINFFSALIVVILFNACSSPVAYTWRGQAKAHLDNYQKMMLEGDHLQAEYYLLDAVKEAKLDSSLETLAVVYLTECAMNRVLNIEASCHMYTSIENLVKNEYFQGYKELLMGENISDLNGLGKYRSIYDAIKDRTVTKDDIDALETIYAKSIGAMMVERAGLASKDIVLYMIDVASKEHKKRLMVLWMKKLKVLSSKLDQEKLSKVIEVLSR